MKRYLFLIAAAALASSCSVMRQVNYKEFSARNVEPRQDALVVPLKAEMELTADGRIDKSMTYTLQKNQLLTNQFIEERKKETLSATAQAYNADVIIGALISVNYEEGKSGNNKTLTIRVTGYPARYVHFRNIDCKDQDMMHYYLNTKQDEVSLRNASVVKR